MNGKKLGVFMALIAALIMALVVLVPLAGASSTTPTQGMMGGPGDDNWCGGGFWDGSGTWGGTGMWGAAFGATWLRNNPAAFDAWLALRADHMTELRAWCGQYKGNLRSPEAQAALQTLWQDHWNDMKAFYQQYADGTSWVCPALGMWGGGMMGGMGGMMWGTGYGAGWLMRHPGAFSGWQTLRAKQLGQVQAWWTKYHAHPFSTAAKDALATMRSHHKTQDLTFLKKHNVSNNTAWSYRGWMGLGGTWGGWGW
jgi:hypothetical protein